MTEEQIADLELTVRAHWHSEEDWADMRESLPRLLEERRRLLDALKYLYATEDEQWKSPNLDPEAAIAFAEEPAPKAP